MKILILRYLDTIGLNPKFTYLFVKNVFSYFTDLFRLKKQANKDFPILLNYPVLIDKEDSAGVANGHYFHQDLYVASKIFDNKPLKHVDIGSRIDGFVAHVAVYREIEVLDIRKVKNNVSNIVFRQMDFMNFDDKFINYADSISSLHAIEHFGLGRYGDPIDYNGHIKAIENVYKMLKEGGRFYFSVPIGWQRIEFNAHRVFSLKYIWV